MPLYDVLYRDRDVIVVNKAAGLLSQSDTSGDPDLLTLLAREVGRPVFPVHRLDRGVGGLIAVALSQPAAAKLSSLVSREDGAFKKEYLAVLHGRFDAESGTLTDHLVRDGGRTRVVPEGTRDAKIARLAYQFCEPHKASQIPFPQSNPAEAPLHYIYPPQSKSPNVYSKPPGFRR